MTGVIVLPLLAIAGPSGLQWRDEWWPAHAIVGAAVIPLVGVKIGATGWRAAGYYARRAAYRVWGAPPAVERVNGVIISGSTSVVVVTGCVMWAKGTQDSPWSTWHTDGCVVLAVSAGIHVLQRLPLAWRASVEEAVQGWRTRPGTVRLLLCCAAVLAGVGVGALAAGMRNPPRHDLRERVERATSPAPVPRGSPPP